MIRKIQDLDLANKKVIIRCDFNVPIIDGKIIDDNRIVESLKTINYALKYAQKVIILSHLGRIKTEEDKLNNSLYIVSRRLEELLNEKVVFCKYDDDIYEKVEKNRIIMFENTRFFDLDNKKESNCDIELSKYFSSFADVFINDAFGTCHRKNASNVGISKFLPSAIGFLIQKEIKMLDMVRKDVEKPFTVIMGGSKVSDKILLIDKMIEKADNLIISGAMAFTFLKSQGFDVGNSIVDNDSIDYAKDLLNKYSNKIILPVDFYTGKEFSNDTISEYKVIDDFKSNDIGLDVGEKTINMYKEILNKSSTIFFNGPVGAFELEKFSNGTKKLCDILSNIDSTIIVGGGDSSSAAKKYNLKCTYISTGGGASIEYIEGKKLPGLDLGEVNEEV